MDDRLARVPLVTSLALVLVAQPAMLCAGEDEEVDLRKLVVELRDPDPDIRDNASRELSSIGADRIPELIELLQDPLVDVRIGAVWALGGRGGLAPLGAHQAALKAESTLRESLEDADDPVLRVAAARTLGMLADPEEMLSLLIDAMLDEQDAQARAAAAEAIGDLDDVPGYVGDYLVRAMEDDSADVRAGAAASLVHFPEAARGILHILLADLQADNARLRGAAALALYQLSPQAAAAMPQLINLLEDDSNWVCLQALWAIGSLAKDSEIAEQALPQLVALIESDDSRIVGQAAAIAVRVGDPALVVPGLVTQLESSDDAWMLWTAARGIMPAGEAAAPALPHLSRLLGHEEWRVQRAAHSALVAIGEMAVPTLVEYLSAEDARVRRATAEALGAIGPDAADAVPALERLRDDPDEDVRNAVADAIAAVTGG